MSDPLTQADALRQAAEAQGDPALAAEAVALLRATPATPGVALALSAALRTLGALADDRDALDAAVVLAREAPPGPAAKAALGAALAVLGERIGDVETLGAALEAYETAAFPDALFQARMRRNQGAVLTLLGKAMAERGLLIEATHALRDARSAFAALGAPEDAALAAENLCHALRLLGEPTDDKAPLAEAVAAGRAALIPALGPRRRAAAETNLANALLALGPASRAEALAFYRAALDRLTGPADAQRRAAARHNLLRAERIAQSQSPI